MRDITIVEEITVNEYMGICSHCYHEFDLYEKAYIDSEDGYVCEDCREDLNS